MVLFYKFMRFQLGDQDYNAPPPSLPSPRSTSSGHLSASLTKKIYKRSELSGSYPMTGHFSSSHSTRHAWSGTCVRGRLSAWLTTKTILVSESNDSNLMTRHIPPQRTSVSPANHEEILSSE